MNRVALAGGPVLFTLTLVLGAPSGLPVEGWRVAGMAGWMAVWWLTGVIPLEATALLPLVVLPLAGVLSVREAAAPYADPIIFLFLGGFLLAATLERWDLHRRFAFATIRVSGTDGPRVVLAFMLASAGLSMWISNTATAVMMLPIAGAVASGVGETAGGPDSSANGFATALLLGVAYGCSIGGVATLIGTPPNAIFAGAASELLGREVGFGGWMALGLPVAVPMFLACWWLLVRLFRVRGPVEGLRASVDREARTVVTMSGAERFIVVVFGVTALAWIMRAPKMVASVRIPGLTDLNAGISDTGIALAAALVLFAVPLRNARFPTALDWRSASRVPWGILLLFGGGLALAGAFAASGLTEWIGGRLIGLRGTPLPVILTITVTLFVLLTELTSNTATAALAMPLIAGVATGLGVSAYPMMVAATFAASMAFMLPVATPPNAVVYGAGVIRSRDMARAGIWLNGVAVVVITLVVWTLT